MGLRDGLDGCRKSRPNRDSIPGPSATVLSIFIYCACIHLGEDLWDVTCHFTWRRNIYSLIILGTFTKTCCYVCASFYSTNTSLCTCRITVTGKLKSRSRSQVTVHKTIRLRENYKTGIPCLWYSLKLRHYTCLKICLIKYFEIKKTTLYSPHFPTVTVMNAHEKLYIL